MSDPVSAIRSLPRFAYLSPAEAREVVLAVLGAVDVEVMARALAAAGLPVSSQRSWNWHYARAARDALVAEVQEEGK